MNEMIDHISYELQVQCEVYQEAEHVVDDTLHTYRTTFNIPKHLVRFTIEYTPTYGIRNVYISNKLDRIVNINDATDFEKLPELMRECNISVKYMYAVQWLLELNKKNPIIYAIKIRQYMRHFLFTHR